MTWVTVSCTVWAEAPGYVALIVIWGGAIGGYWETGRVLIASKPASMTIIAITTAKIGRFMKNLGIKCLLHFFGAAAFGAPAGVPSVLPPNGTALTGVPGRAFWSPSRMTRSP